MYIEGKESNSKPVRDPNVYLAAERTFLAWIRTGLAMMGFGFVVARFGLFLREVAATGAPVRARPGVSAKFGTALVILGVVLTISSLFRYVHMLRNLERGVDFWRPSKLAILLGAAMAAIGAMVSVYLLVGF